MTPDDVEVRTLPRTQEELKRAALEAEAWLDSVDPAELEAEDTHDLRAIAVALSSVADAEEQLRDAVVAARLAGRSWGRISMVLGVSKQAARQRFENAVGAAQD
ncbi:MAG: sigma-70 family RNA polymerase sigma factor [Acidimicrobiia bacterium]